MGQQFDLQAILKGFTEHVYFQPSSNLAMEYPCIVYQRDYATTLPANNKPYRNVKRYLVTVIAPRPDSDIPDKVAKLPMCVFDRFYKADELNHDVFKLFF